MRLLQDQMLCHHNASIDYKFSRFFYMLLYVIPFRRPFLILFNHKYDNLIFLLFPSFSLPPFLSCSSSSPFPRAPLGFSPCDQPRKADEKKRLEYETRLKYKRDKYAQLHYATRIGREEGAKQINELNKRLIELGRIDDLKRTVEDSDYQEQLLKEMKIIARYD